MVIIAALIRMLSSRHGTVCLRNMLPLPSMPVLHSLEVSARLHTNVIVRFCSSAIRLVARPGASIKLGVWFKLTPYHAIRFTHADGMTGPMQHRMRRTELSYSLCLVKPSCLPFSVFRVFRASLPLPQQKWCTPYRRVIAQPVVRFTCEGSFDNAQGSMAVAPLLSPIVGRGRVGVSASAAHGTTKMTKTTDRITSVEQLID
jgi:hypothetical protein